MKNCILDVLFGKEIKCLDIAADLSYTFFEAALLKLDMIEDDFLLYVHPGMYGEAIRIVSGWLALTESNKSPRDLIRVLTNADFDDWIIVSGNKAIFSPGV